MNQVLLTVSGIIDPDIEKQISGGSRPEADYIAKARAFGADLMDYGQARQCTGIFGKILEKIGGVNFLLAWACFRVRRRYNTIFTDGEQIGLPLAWLLKFLNMGTRPRHLMIVHILSTRPKQMILDLFRLYTYIDTFFVYSTWQKPSFETAGASSPNALSLPLLWSTPISSPPLPPSLPVTSTWI